MWLHNPADLSDAARAALWDRSRQVKHFDAFLSHTWKTSGKWKLLSLLLHSGYHTTVLIWATTVLSVAALCLLHFIPSPWPVKMHVMDFQAACPVGPCIMLASIMATILGLFASPYFPNLLGKPDMCFFDMASIHQTDSKLMERGIYGIGGFLSVTRDLRVLWSPPYLSRLWCVFELSAYRTANPQGKVTLAPLFVEALVCAIMLWEYFFTLIYWTARISQVEEIYNYLAYLLAILPSAAAMHMTRRSHRAKHRLFADLEQFDLSNVKSSNDFDKNFIHSAIQQWYGSEDQFTAFVRGPLRKELLNTMSSSALVAYPWLLLTPVIASSVTCFAGLWLGGAPARCLMSYVIGSFFGFDILWILNSLALILYLCDRFAEPACTPLLDHGQTLLIFLAFACCYYIGAVLSMWAYTYSLLTSFAWLSFALVVSCLISRLFKPHCCYCPPLSKQSCENTSPK